MWLASERPTSGEHLPASGVFDAPLDPPSLMTRLAAAGERFLAAHTRWEVFTALEEVLLGMAGIEEFAVLQLTRSGWMPIWWSGESNADLTDVHRRRGRNVLRESLATYSLEVGPHLVATLAVLRARGGGAPPAVDDEVVAFACYETGKKLKGDLFASELPTSRTLKRVW
jgi:hypothetical protein